jgi:hypothetical protein
MTTKRKVKFSVQNRQGGALVLIAGIERLPPPLQRVCDIDRPVRQRRPILKRQGEYEMTDALRTADCGRDIEGLRRRIDHRRSGDAQGINIAAAEGGSGNRRAKRTSPQLPPGGSVERVHLIAFSRGKQDPGLRARLTPK